MRIIEHLKRAPVSKREMRRLLQKITGFSASDLFLREDHDLDEHQERELNHLIEKRKEGYPLEYILGYVPFFRRDFVVSEHCLIPRPETEGLIELALDYPAMKILDVCTGTGVIGITMSLETKASVTCSDINPNALQVAMDNAEKNGAEIQFIQSDLFDEITDTYDMIISNPPYIQTDVLQGLEVAKFEPHLALDGGSDGLQLIKGILDGARSHLYSGGYLLMEIGYDQGDATRKLAESYGYSEVEISRDLAGLDRYFKGKWTSSLK